jgi:hypothetical protein
VSAEHSPSRTEHNQARRAEPPLQRPGDAGRPGNDGSRPPADAAARAAGTGAERPGEQGGLPRDAGPGARGRPSAEAPSRTEHNEARHARPPIERAEEQPETPDNAYTWPPPQADRDHARALYRKDFGDKSVPDSAGFGRDSGVNEVGDKPDRSPGDTSDLSPTGPELVEGENEDDSRGDRFRKKVDREIGDVIDRAKSQVETVKDLLERPPPTGHAEVAVNSGPVFGPEIPQHSAVDPSATAELGMVLGVIGFQAGRWLHHKIETWRKD